MFRAALRGALVLLTAGHVVHGCDPTDLRAPVFREGGATDWCRIQAIIAPDRGDEGDPDWLDFAFLIPDDGGAKLLDAIAYAPTWLVDMRRAEPHSLFAVAGYARRAGYVDYDAQAIHEQMFLTPARYVEPAGWKWCHKLTLDRAPEHGVDGSNSTWWTVPSWCSRCVGCGCLETTLGLSQDLVVARTPRSSGTRRPLGA